MNETTFPEPTTTTPSPTGARQFFRDNLILRLEFATFGITRKADKNEITSTADRAMLAVGKRLIESDAYDAIRSHDNATRRIIAARTAPAPIFKSGSRIVRATNYEKITAILEEAGARRAALVDTFITEYAGTDATPGLPEQARALLGRQWDPADYPSPGAVRDCYRWRAIWLELAPPAALPGTAAAEAAAKLDEAIQEGIAQARAALRLEIADLIGRLQERLTPDSNGRAKVFRDSAVSNVREWFDLFRDRDIAQDADLLNLIDKGRSILSGVTPDALRESAFTRRDIAEALAPVAQAIQSLAVADRPTRAYGDDTE